LSSGQIPLLDDGLLGRCTFRSGRAVVLLFAAALPRGAIFVAIAAQCMEEGVSGTVAQTPPLRGRRSNIKGAFQDGDPVKIRAY